MGVCSKNQQQQQQKQNGLLANKIRINFDSIMNIQFRFLMKRKTRLKRWGR